MSQDPVIAILARLEEGQAALRAHVTRMDDGQSALGADLLERLDQLQCLDHLRKAYENTRDEMRAMKAEVAEMREEMNTLRSMVRKLTGR